MYPNLTKLALGLAMVHKSSSEAERDISQLDQIFAGDKKSKINQTTMNAKINVQSSDSGEGKTCSRCIAADKERDDKAARGEVMGRRQVSHCHCSFLNPDEEELADMKSGGPGRRCVEKVGENKGINVNINSSELQEV